MKFSDQLEQRFTTMVGHYPTKRSVLVPMLLYIQDELGALTDEAIHEIAKRTDSQPCSPPACTAPSIASESSV